MAKGMADIITLLKAPCIYYVTQHDKIGLMYTKYTPSHYSTYFNLFMTNCIN